MSDLINKSGFIASQELNPDLFIKLKNHLYMNLIIIYIFIINQMVMWYVFLFKNKNRKNINLLWVLYYDYIL